MGGKGSESRDSEERVSKELVESGVEGVSDPMVVFCPSAKSGRGTKASAAVICSFLIGS